MDKGFVVNDIPKADAAGAALYYDTANGRITYGNILGGVNSTFTNVYSDTGKISSLNVSSITLMNSQLVVNSLPKAEATGAALYYDTTKGYITYGQATSTFTGVYSDAGTISSLNVSSITLMNGAFVVDSIPALVTGFVLYYDKGTGEISCGDVPGGPPPSLDIKGDTGTISSLTVSSITLMDTQFVVNDIPKAEATAAALYYDTTKGYITYGQATSTFTGVYSDTGKISSLNVSTITLMDTQFVVNDIPKAATTAAVLYYDTTKGSITYGDKTFVIDHPLDTDKYLVHACLEGPEAGIYYRGRSCISNNSSSEIVLPAYVSAIGYDFTVQVTPIFNGTLRTLNVSRVTNGKFTVYGEDGELDWHVYGTRSKIVVEPLKAYVTVEGTGPYRWISH